MCYEPWRALGLKWREGTLLWLCWVKHVRPSCHWVCGVSAMRLRRFSIQCCVTSLHSCYMIHKKLLCVSVSNRDHTRPSCHDTICLICKNKMWWFRLFVDLATALKVILSIWECNIEILCHCAVPHNNSITHTHTCKNISSWRFTF